MTNKLLRVVASLFSHAPPASVEAQPRERLWVGREFHDPDGITIGRVVGVRPDPIGGAWVEVRAEWGIEWMGLGGRHAHFSFHSDDVEEEPPGILRLKRSILEYRVP